MRQLTPVPTRFTDVPDLPALPEPAHRSPGACADGCYTNRQVRDALSTALGWGLALADRLRSIAVLSEEAARAAQEEGKAP